MKEHHIKNLQDIGFRWLRLFDSVISRFFREGYLYKASALAYTTLLSLVPLLAVLFAVFAVFPVFSGLDLKDKVQDFVLGNFIPTKGEDIAQWFNTFIAQTGKLSVVGFASLIVTALMLLKTIETSFNEVWHVKQKRKGVSAFVSYWAILSLAPVFIGLSVFLSSYLFSLSLFHSGLLKHQIEFFFIRMLPVMLLFFGFTLLYTVVPNCQVRFRFSVLGGLVATILFELSRKGFALYLLQSTAYKSIYGALSIIPIFLIWIFIVWLVILIGALFAYEASMDLSIKEKYRLDGFTHAVIWLGFFWKAQHQEQGEGLSLRDLLKKTHGHYQVVPGVMLDILTKASLICRTDSGDYVLQRDLSAISMGELYELLPWRAPVSRYTDLPESWQKTVSDQLHEFHQDMMAKLAFPVSNLYK